ncbi:phage tail assembly chaperone [Cupriavidus basilensis]
MATELDLNGSRYSIGRLSAMQQFHVSRRVAPILPALIHVFAGLEATKKPLPESLPRAGDAAPAVR